MLLSAVPTVSAQNSGRWTIISDPKLPFIQRLSIAAGFLIVAIRYQCEKRWAPMLIACSAFICVPLNGSGGPRMLCCPQGHGDRLDKRR